MESLSKAKRSVISSLGKKKMRLKHGLFSIEGDKSVRDILLNYPLKFDVDSVIAGREWFDKNLKSLTSAGIPESRMIEAGKEDLAKASSLSTPAEVIAVCRLPEPAANNSLLSEGLYLLLDGIQDPGNMGTIIRTAHWFGIERIYATPTTVDIFNPKTIQSTMGSLAAVEVVYTDLRALINSNPEIPVVGLLLDGDSIYNTPLPSSAFVIMGNEGSGISEELRSLISLPLTIPPCNPASHAESLNVAIATGITLFQFRNPNLC